MTTTLEHKKPVPPPAGLSLGGILVPVDFSESSRKALHYALAFARQFQAAVTVLHVVPLILPDPRFALAAPGVQEKIFRDGQEQLAAEIQGHGEHWAALKPLVRQGVAFNEIVNAARELGSDLIVLATHGRTGLKHILLGSTAERVVRYAPCPVLVVREREHDFA
jgi:nucleotide-binding universal stress UspA family protein